MALPRSSNSPEGAGASVTGFILPSLRCQVKHQSGTMFHVKHAAPPIPRTSGRQRPLTLGAPAARWGDGAGDPHRSSPPSPRATSPSGEAAPPGVPLLVHERDRTPGLALRRRCGAAPTTTIGYVADHGPKGTAARFRPGLRSKAARGSPNAGPRAAGPPRDRRSRGANPTCVAEVPASAAGASGVRREADHAGSSVVPPEGTGFSASVASPASMPTGGVTAGPAFAHARNPTVVSPSTPTPMAPHHPLATGPGRCHAPVEPRP